MSTTPTVNTWLTPETTLATIALRSDAYAAVLDRRELDFCCGGRRTLAEACAAAGIEVEGVLAELCAEGTAGPISSVEVPEWSDQPLRQLIDFIVSTHHAFTRATLARLEPLAAKVFARHGEQHPELAYVSDLVRALADDLEPHMAREEKVLFPYIHGLTSPRGARLPPLGTVRNPVRVMMREHDQAAVLLADLSDATAGFAPPAGACSSYRALYRGLADLRMDLLKHVSLENNVLFPRAIALEDQQRAGQPQRDHVE
jgi:regulator of cell morphogenesis and NO signaling